MPTRRVPARGLPSRSASDSNLLTRHNPTPALTVGGVVLFGFPRCPQRLGLHHSDNVDDQVVPRFLIKKNSDSELLDNGKLLLGRCASPRPMVRGARREVVRGGIPASFRRRNVLLRGFRELDRIALIGSRGSEAP
jgi:hypothetical protein